MSKFNLSAMLVITIALMDLSFPPLLQAGESMKFEADKISYKISLSSIGGAPRFINNAISFDGSIAWLDPAQLWITVQKPTQDSGDNFNLVWPYMMGPLGVGDDFLMQGQVYEVAAINIKKLKFIPPYQFDGFCREDSCNPSAEIIRVRQIASTSRKDTILLSKVSNHFKLPQASGVTLWKSNKCFLDVFLVDVEMNGHEYTANIKSIVRSSVNGSNDLGCQEKSSHEFFKVSVGEVVDFGGFGRFIVESISPAESRHSDWVILVPENNDTTAVRAR